MSTIDYTSHTLAERIGKDGKRVLEKLTFKEIEY